MVIRHDKPEHYVSGPLMLSCCRQLVKPAPDGQIVFPVYCGCSTEPNRQTTCQHLGDATGEVIPATCTAYAGWPVHHCNFHHTKCTEKPARVRVSGEFIRNCLACYYDENGYTPAARDQT